jgi:hypothetical protein
MLAAVEKGENCSNFICHAGHSLTELHPALSKKCSNSALEADDGVKRKHPA